MRTGLEARDGLFETRWYRSARCRQMKNRPIVGDSDRKRCELKSREFSFEIKNERF